MGIALVFRPLLWVVLSALQPALMLASPQPKAKCITEMNKCNSVSCCCTGRVANPLINEGASSARVYEK